eukprot:GFYU01000349.1.p1 GENE.GFYU01000349.1~~GFYU01000349.1.p1  ORF type:complete len:424 (-),score=104.04 GFYU01000349.1:234-1505(-)
MSNPFELPPCPPEHVYPSRPKYDHWKPDSEANTCTKCDAQFGWTVRKHHCRKCGGIFCWYCVQNYIKLPPCYGFMDTQMCCEACAAELAKESAHPVGTPEDQHPETKYAKIRDDVTLAYEEFGDAKNETIMLVMGLGVQMLGWRAHFCRMLAERGYHVVRFDNRDVGLSSRMKHKGKPNIPWMHVRKTLGLGNDVGYHLTDMAEDNFMLMDFLNIERAHVVGASMGGMISQEMALMKPHRVVSLTSIMSTTGDESLSRPSLWLLRMLTKPVSNDPVEALSHMEALLRWIQSHYFCREAFVSFIKEVAGRSRDRTGIPRHTAAIMMQRNRTPVLKDLEMPVLIIHGAVDPLVPLDHGHATANACGSNAKMVVYPDMAHDIPRPLWPSFCDVISGIAKEGSAKPAAAAAAPASSGAADVVEGSRL